MPSEEIKETETSNTFVNVLMPAELADKLEAMVKTDDTDRSKFIRSLITREWARRERIKARALVAV